MFPILSAVFAGLRTSTETSHSRGRGFDSPRLHSRFRILGGLDPPDLRLFFVRGVRRGVRIEALVASARATEGYYNRATACASVYVVTRSSAARVCALSVKL
jgi:hypothetical protein